MRVLLMPAGKDLQFEDIEGGPVLQKMEAMRELLDGYPTVAHFPHPLEIEGRKIVMLVDEDALSKTKPINWQASALYGTQTHGQYLYGDAFFSAQTTVNQEVDLVDFPDVPLEAARAALTRHLMAIPVSR